MPKKSKKPQEEESIVPVKEGVYHNSGRKPHQSTIAFQNRLYRFIMDAYEDKSYKTKVWQMPDLIKVLYEEDDTLTITPKKRATTHRIIGRIREGLEEEGIFFYRVPGYGYCILSKREDYLRVAQFNLMQASTKFHITKKVADAGGVVNQLMSLVPAKRLTEAKALLALM